MKLSAISNEFCTCTCIYMYQHDCMSSEVVTLIYMQMKYRYICYKSYLMGTCNNCLMAIYILGYKGNVPTLGPQNYTALGPRDYMLPEEVHT